MFQHPKGFAPSVPVKPEAVPLRPATAAPSPAAAPSRPRPASPAPGVAPSRPTVAPSTDAAAAPISLMALGLDWMFIWHRRRLIAICVGVALLGAGLADLLMTSRYRAISQIMIGPVDLRVVEKSVMPPAQTADANVIQVESETRILTSDRVLRRVVESERLATDPDFGGRAASFLSKLRAWLAGGNRRSDPEFAALRQLQRSVTAKRSERTYVVDLIVDTTDPEKSARIANAISQAYLDEQTAARSDAARRAGDSVSARLAELRERVRQAEEQVERYKRDHSIVGAGGRLVEEQQLSELNNQLVAAKARTAETKARYEQVLRLQRSGADPGATAEAVQSVTIGRLREMYAAVARQEANLTAELGPRHPWVIDARAQVRNAERLIAEEIARVAEATRNDYERAMANENSLVASLDALKRKSMDTSLAFVKLRELERESDATRAVYESYLVRAREMREQERLDTANVRILSDAQPPQDRIWPPRRLILLLAGLMAGVLAGAGLAYFAELTGRNSRALFTKERVSR